MRDVCSWAPPAAASAIPSTLNSEAGRVLLCVMQDFDVVADDLHAPSRGSPRAALARQVAMYLCHVGLSLSFEAIGRLFGRDRTTVAHACRLVEDRRDDIWFDCRIAALELALAGKASNNEERGQ